MRMLIVGYDWNLLFQRPQQLARVLARAHQVTYWSFAPFWVRQLINCRRVHFLQNPSANLTVVHTWQFLPYRLDVRFPRADSFAARLQFQLWGTSRSGNRADVAILASGHLTELLLWERARARLKVYDCFDDNVHFFRPGSREAEHAAMVERRAIARADVVLASSSQIYNRLVLSHRRVILVPNGADVSHFSAAARPPIPAELVAITGPILGFVGAIQSWIDTGLIAQVADELPEYTIVMVGPVECDVTVLRSKRNVVLAGSRPYSVLPSFVHRFDVCMIPFHDNTLTQAVDPIKFYEYSAAGKPVVTTPLPAMKDRGDVVYLAATAREFAKQVRRARAEDTSFRQQRRRALAVANSWLARGETILAELSGQPPHARGEARS